MSDQDDRKATITLEDGTVLGHVKSWNAEAVAPLEKLEAVTYEASFKLDPYVADLWDEWQMESDEEPPEGETAWSVETEDGGHWFCLEKPLQDMFQSKTAKVWQYTGVKLVGVPDLHGEGVTSVNLSVRPVDFKFTKVDRPDL